MSAGASGLIRPMSRYATVSLYEAKTRLSHLVDRASRGDEVVIGDRAFEFLPEEDVDGPA